ncbi:MAG TPA: PRC-barrel domain-containing protein [Pirellulales bacterium]|jgi:sporulation protein YlmC with PRC-barrel domain|nr:PRC-barrel domain-containing protein [Pirellulales bacterium]
MFARWALAIAAVGLWMTAPACAADNKAPADEGPTKIVDTMHHARVSTVEDMHVRNAAGEDIGKIKDLVVDVNSGKVLYAALDFGGFLGVGDKYFAVPWHALQVKGTDKDQYVVLNVTKERLKEAPGFDKNHWPDMANPNWAGEADRFYGPARTTTQTVR